EGVVHALNVGAGQKPTRDVPALRRREIHVEAAVRVDLERQLVHVPGLGEGDDGVAHGGLLKPLSVLLTSTSVAHPGRGAQQEPPTSFGRGFLRVVASTACELLRVAPGGGPYRHRLRYTRDRAPGRFTQKPVTCRVGRVDHVGHVTGGEVVPHHAGEAGRPVFHLFPGCGTRCADVPTRVPVHGLPLSHDAL